MIKIFSVSELNSAIKSLLEPPFRSIALKGEISNFKQQSSGHLYFSLKDDASQISAVLFKGNASRLTRLPKEGDQVQILGELSLYLPRGQYQIVVRELQFLGQGELLLKLQQLKEELQKRGWLDSLRKKPLPAYPKKIGVITSPTGAVIQDMIHVLTRRFPNIHILLYPVKVQGVGAAEEIAKAIQDCNHHRLADVLIVGRGGGSIEDLWAFNEEVVAKAIFESKIPIVSAVGHETDFTIADFVADVRAPTPSAAAEIVVPEQAAIFKFLMQTHLLLNRKIHAIIDQKKHHLATLKKHPSFMSPLALLTPFLQSIDYLRSDLQQSMQRRFLEQTLKLKAASQHLQLLRPSARLQQLKNQLSPYLERYEKAMQYWLQRHKERLHHIGEHLSALNPRNVLKKGYALVKGQNNTLLTSKQHIQSPMEIHLVFHDGSAKGTMHEVRTYDTTPFL